MSDLPTTDGYGPFSGLTKQDGYVVLDQSFPGEITELQIRRGKLIAKSGDMWHIVDTTKVTEVAPAWKLPDYDPPAA